MYIYISLYHVMLPVPCFFLALATNVGRAKHLLIPGSRIHPASVVVIPVGSAVGRCRWDGNLLGVSKNCKNDREMMAKVFWKMMIS